MLNPLLASFLYELLTSETARPVRSTAQGLGISESTLFRLAGRGRETLARHGLELVSLYGKGFLIRGSAEAKERLAEELLREDTYVRLTQEQKRCFLYFQLLDSPTMVKLSSLGRALKACDSNVSRQIEALNGELACFNVAIESRRGFGTLVRGGEWDIRKSLLFLSVQRIDENEYVSLILESAARIDRIRKQASSFTRTLFSLLDPRASLGAAFRLIDELEGRSGCPFTDEGLVVVSLYLAIAAIRRENGFTLGQSARPRGHGRGTEGQQPKGGDRGAAALRRHLPLLFPAFQDAEQREREVDGLMGLILDNGLLKEPEAQLDCAEHATALMGWVESETGMGVALSAREEALLASRRRLTTLVNQGPDTLLFWRDRAPAIPLGPGMHERLIQRLASAGPAIVGRGLCRDEAGYCLDGILPYFTHTLRRVRAVVVCASGIGVSYMLAERLETALPELEIADRISFRDLSDSYIEAKRIDFIISTIEIGSFRSPVVRIALPLRQEDVSAIERTMEECTDGTP